MTPLISSVEHLGLWVIFAAVLLQQCGVPMPGFLLLVIAGAWSVRGGASAALVVLVAVSASFIADFALYAAGQRYGQNLLMSLCRLSINPGSCIESARQWFERLGTRGALIAKFVPGLSLVSGIMSGIVRLPLPRFLMYQVSGATLWASTAVALGVVFHDDVAEVFERLRGAGRAGGMLALTIVIGFGCAFVWRRRKARPGGVIDSISVQALSALMSAGCDPPTVLDARPRTDQLRDGIIPGAVDLGASHFAYRSLSRDQVIVIYCSCRNDRAAQGAAREMVKQGFIHVRSLQGGIQAWQHAGLQVVMPIGLP